MKNNILVFLISVLIAVSCSDSYLEVQPSNQVSSQNLFQTLEGARSVLDGVLRDMRTQHSGFHDRFGVKSVDLTADLMGEDMVVEQFHWFGADYRFENHGAKGIRSEYTWTLFYRIIYNLNEILNNIDEAEVKNEAQRQDLKAQALSLRAYAYFQLIQLFQHTYAGHENQPGVPVYTEATTTGKPRSPVREVYNLIIADLEQAIVYFNESSLPQRHISNLTMNVAKGLRARVALVMQDWEKAAEMASEARDGYRIMSANEYKLGFDNYKEQNWMWGLEINNEQSTTYGSWFSHVDWSIQGYCGAGLSRKSVSIVLYNLMDDDDVRKALIDTKYIAGSLKPDKFSAGNDKGWAADYILMRPEEMLLIEAEALARMNREDEARNLLQELRRYRLTNPGTVDVAGDLLLQEILLERRIELWGEGFALLDIKRLKKGIDRTNSNHNPVVARTMVIEPESSIFNFQIPQKEIDSNPGIGDSDQNQ